MTGSIHLLPSNPNPSIRAPHAARYTAPSLKLILSKALARVAAHVDILDEDEATGLDPSLLVIEDTIGDLVYTKGDLSFLMPAAPVLNQWFASQLNAGTGDEYDSRQREVWEQRNFDGEQFPIAPDWNAAILPMYAEADAPL